MPALLTRTYTAPSRAATSSTALSTEAALVTSTFWKMPPPSCASPSFTSQEATRQPSWAKRRAVARPMPPAPPVTMTTLSFNPVSIIYVFPQMSPTVKPFGNGSSGSTTYCAKPVIHACPESAGTTAAYGPTRVSSSRRPVNVVPRMPSWTKSSYSPSCPLACSAAILAQVPVPQGERSITPVQVSGRAQSSVPVETTTAFLRCASSREGGPESCAMLTPAMPGFSRCTTGSCSCVAALIISAILTVSRPSSGSRVRPSGSGAAIPENMPPYATSTVTVPRPRTSTLASRCVAKAGTLRKVTLRTLPWCTSASTAIRPAGVSSLRCVTGSTALTMPVSISTVTTQMVLVPDIGGYSTCSMMTNPASASGWLEGRIRLQLAAGYPRGSRSMRRRIWSACFASQFFLSNMVCPGTARTPPALTRPGSPHAWASTAVIMLENRNCHLFSMLHCTHAKLLRASRPVGPAVGGRKENDRAARIRRRHGELQPWNPGGWHALCLRPDRPGPQDQAGPRRFRDRGEDLAEQYRNRAESRRHDVQRRGVRPSLPHRYGSISPDERGLHDVLPRPAPVAHHGGCDETRGGGGAHRNYGDGEEVRVSRTGREACPTRACAARGSSDCRCGRRERCRAAGDRGSAAERAASRGRNGRRRATSSRAAGP